MGFEGLGRQPKSASVCLFWHCCDNHLRAERKSLRSLAGGGGVTFLADEHLRGAEEKQEMVGGKYNGGRTNVKKEKR